MGHKDPLLGSLMLSFCRDKQLFKLSETVFNTITEKKIIKKNFDLDVQTFEVEGMKYNHNPSAASCQAVYEVMADITARQVI
jgi:hypothetical protein